MTKSKYYNHPSAVIDKGASIGAETKIWHFSHISSGAKIGKGVSIGQNVYIANNVVIGDGCKIQNNVSIYDNVFLEDEVFCGPSMVFTNVYNPRSAVERKNEYRDTIIKKGATLGANCTIICGNTIGSYSFVGAGACINSNVDDFALMVGVPAKQIGWMSKNGNRLEFSQNNSIAICPESNEKYVIENNILSLITE